MDLVKRCFAVALCVILASPVTLAQDRSPIQHSAEKILADMTQQSGTSGGGVNPYFWPGLGMIIGGGSLMLASNTWLAVDDPGDIRCDVDDSFNVTCDTKVNKAMLFAGIGLAAAGGWLFLKGERMKNIPVLVPIRRGVLVTHRLKF